MPGTCTGYTEARIEWLLANGFHRWFLQEIEQGRVFWPGTTR